MRRAIGAAPQAAENDEVVETALGDALDALAVEAGRTNVRLTRVFDVTESAEQAIRAASQKQDG